MRHNTIIATTFATLLATSAAWAADLPGKGITVKPIQSTITEETFQTLLVSRALEKLGYTVDKPSEVDYNVGYTSLPPATRPSPPSTGSRCMTICTLPPVAIKASIAKAFLLTAPAPGLPD